MTKAPQDDATERPRGTPTKYGWAGFGLITAAATVAFVITAVSLDTLDEFPGWGISGGLVSMVGGASLSRKCGSWSEFWSRVWIWMAAAAVLAGFGVWGVSAQHESRTSDFGASQSPTTDVAAVPQKEDPRVKSREGTDLMFKAGFGALYRLQYHREASEKKRRAAYEYALITCEALDTGMSPRKIYKRMAGAQMTDSEFMFFHMSFMAAVTHVCEEYEPAHERFLASLG